MHNDKGVSLIVKERGAAMPRIQRRWPVVVLQETRETPAAFRARVLATIDALDKSACPKAGSKDANHRDLSEAWLICNEDGDVATFAARLAIVERLMESTTHCTGNIKVLYGVSAEGAARVRAL